MPCLPVRSVHLPWLTSRLARMPLGQRCLDYALGKDFTAPRVGNLSDATTARADLIQSIQVAGSEV